jgi:hypothetical protein
MPAMNSERMKKPGGAPEGESDRRNFTVFEPDWLSHEYGI